MKLLKTSTILPGIIKPRKKKRRKTGRLEIYRLWQDELMEKGFNKLTRFQQGLL